jgi:translation initiation factor IF-3
VTPNGGGTGRATRIGGNEKIARQHNPRHGRGPAPKSNPINDEITANELRVIDDNGEQAGIMLLETALGFADSRNLDLVLISPNAKPPVARVMDYGKYRYEQQKREKEAKKKQKIIQVKEVRLSPSIEEHDLHVKASHAAKFLDDGDKVKVSLRFRGRERGRTQKGYEVMERFAETVKDNGAPEKRAAFEGRNLMMILAPHADKVKSPKAKPASATENKDAAKPAPATENKDAAKPAPATENKDAAKPAPATEYKDAAKPAPADGGGGDNNTETGSTRDR